MAALEKILSQPDFSASPRLSAFLRFVVTETIEGRADRLKAFTIASMALGHDEKFNPKTNSVVRVQAGRLRRLLQNYYEGPGRLDRCEVRLRPGSYVPEFLFRSPDCPASNAPSHDADTDPLAGSGDPAPSRQPARRGRSFMSAASLVVLAACLGLGVWTWRNGSPHRARRRSRRRAGF